MIFDIQHFSLSDGPGIRTTVFLKGCPLHCSWCHNPESQRSEPEIMFSEELCIGCGRCAKVCRRNCHSSAAGVHRFDRTNCNACGLCAEACFSEALKLCGYERSVEKILSEVEEDRPLYDASGGGMTVSGGEPLLQLDFTEELCKKAKSCGLHICLDTSGFVPECAVRRIAPFVDLFLYDIKTVDPEKHAALTGADNTPVLKNLFLLDSLEKSFILRCPMVPGVNDSPEELAGIARLTHRLKNLVEINLEPYHPLGLGKRKSLGLPQFFQTEIPSSGQIGYWYSEIRKLTNVEIVVV